jgi:hypothetical protein
VLVYDLPQESHQQLFSFLLPSLLPKQLAAGIQKGKKQQPFLKREAAGFF